MTFVESVNQFVEAVKGLEQFNIIAAEGFASKSKIHLRYSHFVELAEGQNVDYKPHTADYPFKASFKINDCEVFTLLDRKQAENLGLLNDCPICGNKKETAEAAQ
jgi:hypothetical protein